MSVFLSASLSLNGAQVKFLIVQIDKFAMLRSVCLLNVFVMYVC